MTYIEYKTTYELFTEGIAHQPKAGDKGRWTLVSAFPRDEKEEIDGLMLNSVTGFIWAREVNDECPKESCDE